MTTARRSRSKSRGETPAAERQVSSRQALLKAGGKIVQVRLTSDAAADLAHIRERDGLSTKDAIIAALHSKARIKP